MTAARPRPALLKLTPAAVTRLKALGEKAGEGVLGLRLSVKTGGCAGMEYGMDWARETNPLDEVVEQDGVRLFVDSRAVLYLIGTEMDFEQSAMKSGFVFNNPNQVSACGCGESVTLKPAQAS
ncbi:MAG TPA: iron-sulfur cluster assembly accessory protein [Aestuariivirga sp.]|nr:iron-sulfur cluster assembly accessory protein [Aestuariivirga sp.]